MKIAKKKISYQAKLKQKIRESPPPSYSRSAASRNYSTHTHTGSRNIPSEPIKNTNSFGKRYFGCWVLLCVVIGASILIGFNIAEQNNQNQTTQTTVSNSDTTTTTTTTSSTPYALKGSVTTIHGQTYQLSSFQGKTLIIYFTGASCIPCKAQLPYLVSAYNKYKGTGKVDVVSLDIQGQSIEALKTWESDNGITWKVCQDTGYTISTQLSIYSMPTLVIFDKNGNELNRYVGQQTEATINQIFQDAVK